MNSTQIMQAANPIGDTAFADSSTDPEGTAAFERIVAEDRTEPSAVHRPPRLRRRALIGVGLATAAGAAIAVVGLPGAQHNGAPAAWSVTKNADGSVTVKISDFRDPDGLQRKLRAAGLRAEVGTLPHNCDIRIAAQGAPADQWRSVVVAVDRTTFSSPGQVSNLMLIGGERAFNPRDTTEGTGMFIPPSHGANEITITIRTADLPAQDTVRIGFPADHTGKRMGIGVFSTASGLFCQAPPPHSSGTAPVSPKH
jgi:hypothetical protein